jgi:hypothetical protein
MCQRGFNILVKPVSNLFTGSIKNTIYTYPETDFEDNVAKKKPFYLKKV